MAVTSKKMLKKLAEARIQRAVSGFLIPMMKIVALSKALENAIAEDKSDEDLKAIVAAFPDVEVA